MLAAKILFNSVVSTPRENLMTIEISNFYLMKKLDRPEYIRINIKDTPKKIIQEYNLKQKITDRVLVSYEEQEF